MRFFFYFLGDNTMKQLDKNSDFVRIRLDIPRLTYEHLMELLKLSKSQLVT